MGSCGCEVIESHIRWLRLRGCQPWPVMPYGDTEPNGASAADRMALQYVARLRETVA